MQSKAVTLPFFPLAAQVARAPHGIFVFHAVLTFAATKATPFLPVAFHEDEAKIGDSDTTGDGDSWFAAPGIMKLSEETNEASIDCSREADKMKTMSRNV